jgi:N-acetylglucosamine kinase-like BadF-type ATPase
MAKSKFCIGFNGGHHSSSLLVYNLTDHSCSSIIRGDSVNFHTLAEGEPGLRLAGILNDAAEEFSYANKEEFLNDVEYAVFSFPGVGLKPEQDRAIKVVGSVCTTLRFKVIDDTWAGLYLNTKEARGICAFAGSGSSVSLALGAFSVGKEYKIDGWGYLIGDFGSGFQLATQFFRKLGRRLDRNIPYPLFNIVKSYIDNTPEFEIESPESLERVQWWFDQLTQHHELEWKSVFARLAIPIAETADDKVDIRLSGYDATPYDRDHSRTEIVDARSLVNHCAKQMAISTGIAINRINQKNIDVSTIPLVLHGGMFRNCEYYTMCYKKELRSLLYKHGVETGPIYVSSKRTVYGSLEYGLSAIKGN